MKRIVTFLLVFCLTVGAFTSVYAESEISKDATFSYLLYCLQAAVNVNDENNDDLARIDSISVWKQGDDVAGFNFASDDWYIVGRADMNTGLVTHLVCKVPWTNAGVNILYSVLYAISNVTSVEDFTQICVDENNSLRSECVFAKYYPVLDLSNGEYKVFEYVRVGNISLEDPDNICQMQEFIDLMQK